MSIKPVDFNVMLPKTQEMSISKHNENIKNENMVESEFINQNKRIKKQKSKIKHKEKTDSVKVSRDKEFKKEKDSQGHRRKHSKDRENEEIDIDRKNLGFNIDIRI